MYQPSVDWGPKQSRLRESIREPAGFEQAMRLCVELHAFAHRAEVFGGGDKTLADEVFEGLRALDYAHMPTALT